MVKLSLEIPPQYHTHFSALTDLDFAIATKVLEDAAYAKLLRTRVRSRELILDNATHELGYPLPLVRLERAAELCRADYVIIPDVVNPTISAKQFAQNVKWVEETYDGVNYCPLGAVLSGRSREERDTFCDLADGRAELMCFTFHIPERLTWWGEFLEAGWGSMWSRVHILGLYTLDELKQWVEISRNETQIDFSFDTSKPLRYGFEGISMRSLPHDKTLRGGKLSSKDVLEMRDLSQEQIQCAEDNIIFLKEILRG